MPSLTIQPSSKDAWMEEADPTHKRGTEVSLNIGHESNGLTGAIRSIFEFDISNAPPPAIIISALLYVYNKGYVGNPPYGRTYRAYKLNRTDWVESEVCWSYYKGTTPWTTAGGDYGDPHSDATVAGGWMAWDVLSLVLDAINSGKPAEILIKDVTEEGDLIGSFWSNNYTGNLTLRPMLIIQYVGYVGFHSATSQRRYKASTFSGFTFPDPAGSGFASLNDGYYLIAGLRKTGISTAEALGTDKVNRNVKPAGLATLEAFGTPAAVLVGLQHLYPSGIVTLEALGTDKVNRNVKPAGILSAEALGSLRFIINIKPSGVLTAETLGLPVITTPQTIKLDGIKENQQQSDAFIQFNSMYPVKAFTFKPKTSYTLKGAVLKMYRDSAYDNQNMLPSLFSTDSNGLPLYNLQDGSVIPKSGITTDPNGAEYISTFNYALTAGTLYVILINSQVSSGHLVYMAYQDSDVYADGKFYYQVFAPPYNWIEYTGWDAWFKILTDAPGIPTAEAFGTAIVKLLQQIIAPSGISSSQAFGTAIVKKMLQILVPSGIISQEIFGTLKLNFKVYPSGIVSQVIFGNARIIILFLKPSGIATVEAFGVPHVEFVRQFLHPLGILTGELFGTVIVVTAIMLPPVRWGRPKRLLNALRNLPSDREDGIRRMP